MTRRASATNINVASYQPTIGHDLDRTVACIGSIKAHLDSHGHNHVTVGDISLVIIAACYGAGDANLEHIVTTVVPQRVSFSLAEPVEGLFDVAADGWETVILGDGHVQAAVTRALELGLDGEGLVDAVIRVASFGQIALVKQQAHKYARSIKQDPEELVGFGWIGLRTALRLFDPRMGFMFSTYACTRIRSAMQDGVRAEDVLPKRLTTERNRAKALQEVLGQELGRPPTLAELAERMDTTLTPDILVRLTQSTASINEMTDPRDDNNDTPRWMIDSSETPESAAIRTVLTDDVTRALAELPDTHREVVSMLWMDGLSVRQVQRSTGMSQKTIDEIAGVGKDLLTSQLSAWAPQAA